MYTSTRNLLGVCEMEVFENSWHVAIADLKICGAVNHHYICKCGYVKQIALYNNHANFPYLKCPKCFNSYYIDLETFRDSHSVRYWKEFHWSYELSEDMDGWHIHFYYNTPVLKNMLGDFGTHKQSIQKVSLLYSGVLHVNTLDKKLIKCNIYDKDNTEIGKLLEAQYAKPLLDYVLDNISDTIEWIDFEKYGELTDKERLYVLSFFLQNPNMRDEVLCFWDFKGCEALMGSICDEDSGISLILQNHQKKSIKRALFTNYKAKKGSLYNPMFDYIICHHFDNENFIVPLLNIEYRFKRSLFDNFNLEELQQVFGFLAQYYSQQELYRLIAESIGETFITLEFGDIFRMLREEEFLPIYLEHFRKPRANVKSLHDEVMRIQARYITVYKRTEVEDVFMPFEYDKYTRQRFTCKSSHFEFRLPHSPEELYLWASTLHNCMASYAPDIIKKRTLIVGVFKKDTLTYAIEIKNNSIIQALGKYNKPIPYTDNSEIRQWFQGLHVKDKVIENVA
jgi:hypothetical protein